MPWPGALRTSKFYHGGPLSRIDLRQELACPGLKRRCHIARVAPDSRDGTRASREMRITRAKGVRYVILREFHVSEQSHVDSRAFLRIKNLNRDARKLVHTRDNKTATRVCHITRHVKYENLRRGLPGRPNDTQDIAVVP